MKIAVASQNRRSVTDHLGRCRRFWMFDVEKGAVSAPQLVELAKEETLHALSPHIPKLLGTPDTIICAGMGGGMRARLKARGINAHVTSCDEPEAAVRQFLAEAFKPAAELSS